MSFSEKLREALPDEAADAQEKDEFIQQMVEGKSTLPVDKGLEVLIRPVPGDAFDESHAHLEPAEKLMVFHLASAEAAEFDGMMNEFIVNWVTEDDDL